MVDWTVKLTPLLAAAPTATTTLPVVAPAGTGTTMLVADQLVGVAVVPLNLTVLAPWVAPKPVPVMVTEVPVDPEVGDKLVMFGVTVKSTPLLATLATVTTTLPEVAAAGTVTTIEPALQVVTVAAVPLKVTLPDAPKFEPEMVTEVPTVPEVRDKLVMLGAVVDTVKVTLLLVAPPAVTTTLPVVAPEGTGTTMLVADQVAGVAVIPPNVTVLLPWGDPKLVPAIITEVPTGPPEGDKLVMFGVTVKGTPLLATLTTVTTTLPVEAPLGTGTTMLAAVQVVGVAVVPLNVTVLLPLVAPKPLPEMVTEVPMIPEAADKPVMFGVTVKDTLLLGTLATVSTTLPVVAALGTVTTTEPAVQVVTVAAVPLKVTLPVDPKLEPEMVTVVPTVPDAGDRPVMLGAVAETVKVIPLLAAPPTVTTTLPLGAPLGTGTTILVADQLVGVAVVPLNFTVLLP